ncbi:PAS and helix-turn-helix domain-containing protein [Maritimibacter alkaliphilus]|uniref:PAS and helix-turn-helix domain-containing protein n=1 Tax=Maritimibacter alkaliphilus TaxID=404236 RepID=UPI001C970718|nr:PAS and helix-turn-helix domain-containing protein [Maritimibacter alkaliphilus]MBY6090422.1 PAS and helix-turn-helix domain-containing protein [Maritimibacter alkaliphilus]
MIPEDFAEAAFDMAPVGIVLAQHRIIRACNLTFASMIGVDRTALLGRSFRVLYEDDAEFARLRDVGLAALRGGGSYTDQRILRRTDGSRFWCRFRARTLAPDDPLSRIVMTYAPLGDARPGPELTPRERDVISGLSRGSTSKQIARDLGLSPRTVEDVRARLLRKFKVRNAAELLARLTGPG